METRKELRSLDIFIGIMMISELGPLSVGQN